MFWAEELDEVELEILMLYISADTFCPVWYRPDIGAPLRGEDSLI